MKTKTKTCPVCGHNYDRSTFYRCPNCIRLEKESYIRREVDALYKRVPRPMPVAAR